MFTFREFLKHAEILIELINSSLKMFRKRQNQQPYIKRTEATSSI